jgi:long-chain acyl-CoA synthetase
MLEQLLVEVVEKHPDKTAIVYEPLRISYRDLYTQIQQFSQGLRSIGVRQGSCVAVILPNCPEFVVSFYAAAKLGAIILPLNPLFKEEEIEYYLSDSQAGVIITDLKRAEVCQRILGKLDRPPELVVIGDNSAIATHFDSLMLPEHGLSSHPVEDPSSFAGDVIYQYSSGSTGRPKRVARTQKNLYHEAKNFAETVEVTSTDTILCTVPLFHAHGLGNCLLAATCSGATLVILEQYMQKGLPVEVPFVFRRQRVLELIEQERVTIFPSVPYVLDALAETPVDIQVDLSSLRLCFSAGNFLSEEIFKKFLNRFDIPIRQLYGCTEAGSVAINLGQPDCTFDSVGLPMSHVVVKVVDEQGNELPAGSIGEVLIQSETLTQGYFNLPELNQQAFKNGCFWTGDLGKKNEQGYLYLTGRKKRLIDTGGHKVDPVEVEDVLNAHTKVKEAVVVGTKSPYGGELVKAVIVPQPQEVCEEREILYYCKERLAEFKIPQIIEFRDQLPRSPLGKILAKDLV